jgi:hypothetical protein
MVMDKLTRNTIKFVNQVRDELNLDPIKDLEKGHEGSIDFCPIARSISKDMPDGEYATAYSRVHLTRNGLIFKVIQSPIYIMDWINRFDAGYYGKYRVK